MSATVYIFMFTHSPLSSPILNWWIILADLEFSDDEEDYGMHQQQQQQQQHVEISGAEMVEAGMVLEDQYGSHQQGPDETQGAAEAMVQLSAQYSYYQVCL